MDGDVRIMIALGNLVNICTSGSLMDSINVLVNCLVCAGSVMNSINILVNCLICTGSVMNSIIVLVNCLYVL